MKKYIITIALLAVLIAGSVWYFVVPHYRLHENEKMKFSYSDVVEYATAIDPQSEVKKESTTVDGYEIWEVKSTEGKWHIAAEPVIVYGHSKISDKQYSKTAYDLLDDRQVVIIERYLEKYPELGKISEDPIERYDDICVTAYTEEKDAEKLWSSYKKLQAELPEEVTIDLWVENGDVTITPFVLPLF